VSVCPHEAWQDVPLNGRKCVDCGMWLEDYPEIRPQPTASADAEPVAVIRFDRGAPGNENEMHKVISCDWQPDGEYRLYTEAQMQARADAARREALEEAIDRMGWPEIHAFEDELRKGQGVREDAGGFMLRAIKALFGLKPDTVETYRDAMRAMLKENPNGH